MRQTTKVKHEKLIERINNFLNAAPKGVAYSAQNIRKAVDPKGNHYTTGDLLRALAAEGKVVQFANGRKQVFTANGKSR